ncbi:MAG: DivIVA domain-containing protein [Actinomycetales bacterium]
MTSFNRTGRRRGYDPHAVDAFLERVEARLAAAEAGQAVPLPAREVRRAGFRMVRNGYEPETVDAVLDLLEERVLEVELREGQGGDVADLVERVRPVLEAPAGDRLPRTTRWRRGYRCSEVDDVCDALRAGLLDGTAGVPSTTAIRQSAFTQARHGYDEDAVDAFLDDVVDLLLRAGGRRFA